MGSCGSHTTGREVACSPDIELTECPRGPGFFSQHFFCNTSTLYRMKGSDFLILWGKGATLFFFTRIFFLVCFFFKGIKIQLEIQL